MIEAITHSLGYMPGLTIKGDVIVEWPYSTPEPSPAELAVMVSDYEKHIKILAIKKKAGEVIIERMPEWKQRNMIAEASLIISDGSLTQAQKDEALSDYKVYLAWTKSVRAYSDELEARVVAGEAVDIDIGWPDWPPAGLTEEIING